MDSDHRPFHEIVSDRLKELGENPFSIATKSGVAYDKFRNILRKDERRADAKVETAREICAALGLEFYIGPVRDHGPLVSAPEPNEFAHIPLHDALLSAGDGRANHSEEVVEYLAFRRDWLRRLGVAPSNAVLARASGDSMQPCVWDGDAVLIDRSRTEIPVRAASPKRGRSPVYAFIDDGQARIKRIERPEEGQVILLSDNPDYPPEFARLEDLTIIGKVLWWGHTNRD